MPLPSLTTKELRRVVRNLPRLDLAHLPTPLEEVPTFADEIHGPRLFIKRDDCTGLLFGGNKTRHNELLLGDALQQRRRRGRLGAGVQSNNCRQTAAACAKLGLECRLYLSRAARAAEVQGNLLLDHLVGARVEMVEASMGPALDRLLAEKAEGFHKAGRRPYVWDRKHAARWPRSVMPSAWRRSWSSSRRWAATVGGVRLLGRADRSGAAAGQGGAGAGCAVRLQAPIRWPWNMPRTWPR